MLKKRVLKRLLPLLFSFCCVFSGFLSVNAFADVVVDYDSIYTLRNRIDIFGMRSSGQTDIFQTTLDSTSGMHTASNSNPFTNINSFTAYLPTYEIIPNLSDFYDFYLYGFVVGQGSLSSDFRCSSVDVFTLDNSGNKVLISDSSYFRSMDIVGNTYGGTAFLVKLDLSNYSSIHSITIYDNDLGTLGSRIDLMFKVVPIKKELSSDYLQGIISAINNQTSQLSSDIGQAADDVQQSIEDQYSGDPEEEFSVDDVISQHNEKMGVLSFGSDVMLQFLDMFQSANVGTAELTLPGFNITVENVEYSVWPDYSFNFEQLNEWVPALMSVIRVMLPAFVWLMVLRYCIKVFEDNFLAK